MAKFILLVLFLLLARPLWSLEYSGKLGHDAIVYTKSHLATDEDQIPYARPYFETDLKHSLFAQGPQLQLVVKAIQNYRDHQEDQIDLRRLMLVQEGDGVETRIGVDTLAWSETFGTNILDLVNPRDYQQSIFAPLDESKIPVAMMEQNIYFDSQRMKLNLLWVPLPRAMILPKRHGRYDPLPAALDRIPIHETHPKYQSIRDSEYGVRLKKTFSSGLDTSLIYYHHFNRRPVLFFRPDRLDLALANEAIDSYGMAFSYALEETVFRGDILNTNRTPILCDDLRQCYSNNLQMILGFDFTYDVGPTLGMQYQYDMELESSWVSWLLKETLMDGDLEASYMLFVGIDNPDFWFRWQTKYYWTTNWATTLEADLLAGQADEAAIGPYRKQDRVKLNLDFYF